MPDIRYFDALCVLGRHIESREGQPESPEAVLELMDHYGIHEALVVSALAKDANPLAGNLGLLDEVRDHPRLHPAWTVIPPHSKELPHPHALIDQMRDEGVAALFLFNRIFNTPLADWSLDELLAPMEQSHVPLFICGDGLASRRGTNQTDWDGVVRICRDFPELPVVVSEYRIYGTQRAMFSAMAACENLHIDIRGVWLHKHVEFICREFGAQRAVWSSGLPLCEPGVPMMQVNYSEIGHEELELIAGGNIRRLLEWNTSVAPAGDVELPEPIDDLHRAARERLDLSGLGIYDNHGHIGSSTPNHVIHADLDEIVGEMDRFGVEACCVFGLEGVFGDERYGNDRVFEAVKRHPERFIGFAMVNPNHGEAEMLRELKRGVEHGMKGVKLIASYHGYPEEGPLIDVACRFAHERGQFILNHQWGSAEQMLRLCTEYPDTCFFTGHSCLHFADVARQVENLFICTCPFNHLGMTETFVDTYGADRIMFGSDLTDLPISWGLAPIMYARIPEADKRLILGGNLQRCMKQYGITPGP